MLKPYTKKQRQTIYKQLVNAVPHLDNDHFICNAICSGNNTGLSLAHKMIQERLTGESSVMGWLRKNHYDLWQDIDSQEYRKAWLNALIEEFKPSDL